VVLSGGLPLVHLERGGHSLTRFPAALGEPRWIDALASLVASGQVRSLEIRRVDGDPAGEHPDVVEALLAGGFRSGYRGPILRR
jgi:hypothetical protein